MTGQLTSTGPERTGGGGRRPLRLVLNGRDRTVEAALGTLVVLLLVVAAATSETFFTPTNLTNLLKQMVTTGLLAFGMLVVILTGGIDLSVGSVVAFAGIVTAGLVSGLPIPLAMAVGIAAGIGFGLVNGVLVARFELAPFVVTLAALTTVRGLAFVYSDVPIAPDDPAFFTLGSAMVGPIPLTTVIMLVVFGAGGVFLSRTPAGRSIIAIGGNPETVRLAGINVRRHVVLAYTISGACAGLAGVILASRVGIAQPSVGVAFELDAIAACVIGGASLAGGRGTAKATLGGVLVLALINNLLNLYGVQSFWQQVLKGLIIIAVILVQRVNRVRT
ncbi:ribose transport system permease protein/putative xylitol transport system permease protein [Micromonospora pisi]|uniref:Ribose transport system permease protein/putative xylitol transport system permease protein n=1 Tax=Micromonospora pisi TaxID=589240 RepID=A0A495JEC9_9ACTN|nr:ABC transporter permease [Micromonospora pisi]RKR87091.1 ribose transport system permease protein/putative xylitol transport system permease protein [Micromonospora pisi]